MSGDIPNVGGVRGDTFGHPLQQTQGGVGVGVGGGGVSTSFIGQSITQHFEAKNLEFCQQGLWVRGECPHKTKRWVKIPCKKRTCPVCGKKRLKRMAYRISYGLDMLGGGSGGWFVGTWSRDIDKKSAVKTVGKFVRWLRKGDKDGYVGQPGLEYSSTWEETRRGRLHINLVLAPWVYIPQKLLSEKWRRFGGGRVVWIGRVDSKIGVEVSKSAGSVPGYISKWDQMVLSGRGQGYSKGWPKLANNTKLVRKGNIFWTPECGKWDSYQGDYGEKRWVCLVEPLRSEVPVFESELKLGYWREVRLGEYALTYGEGCDCFDLLARGGDPATLCQDSFVGCNDKHHPPPVDNSLEIDCGWAYRLLP